jgi:hypothetical protein
MPNPFPWIHNTTPLKPAPRWLPAKTQNSFFELLIQLREYCLPRSAFRNSGIVSFDPLEDFAFPGAFDVSCYRRFDTRHDAVRKSNSLVLWQAQSFSLNSIKQTHA